MTIRRLSLLCILLLSLAAPLAASAQEIVYDCKLKSFGLGYRGPDRMKIGMQFDKGKAWLFDAEIAYVHDNPILVPFTKLKNNRYRMKWTLKLPFKGNFKSDVYHRMTLNTKTNRVSITAEFPGFDNVNMGSKGTCQITK